MGVYRFKTLFAVALFCDSQWFDIYLNYLSVKNNSITVIYPDFINKKLFCLRGKSHVYIKWHEIRFNKPRATKNDP